MGWLTGPNPERKSGLFGALLLIAVVAAGFAMFSLFDWLSPLAMARLSALLEAQGMGTKAQGICAYLVFCLWPLTFMMLGYWMIEHLTDDQDLRFIGRVPFLTFGLSVPVSQTQAYTALGPAASATYNRLVTQTLNAALWILLAWGLYRGIRWLVGREKDVGSAPDREHSQGSDATPL